MNIVQQIPAASSNGELQQVKKSSPVEWISCRNRTVRPATWNVLCDIL